ncbi:enoyl-ACP reductase 1 [Ligilactobacillus murinus]|uniref:enoyl-ACP reductase FabI n=1 Tax=Ligilactobacillus murinus TaxID=1622 RepID=UPI001433C38F|nr:enoyl-ACP reductase FabI [Ligilactobacillus murinus]MCR1895477.1 enoyl-ACP reductase FabI [Ligilactobacillus murinus]BDI02304.1 enoyl-ACP reductase 1 [Ligilactobacillus murinus]GFI63323.1 enoyl-[acyl-carrier-protein] reductase [NADH] FabI [Lactobacillaceae bacterium]
MGDLLANKTILVMGVANRRSIAWGCAQIMQEQGANLIYTYQNERLKKGLLKLVGDEASLFECDVADDNSIAQSFSEIKARYGKLDGIVHAIAYAPKAELEGEITNATRAGFQTALDVSAYSLLAVSKAAMELALLNDLASLVTLTYMGSTRAIPNYNTMGIAKAALESGVRYLARDLGKFGIRVNAISAGAIKTLAVTGIKGHSDLLEISKQRTVDQEAVTIREVGGTCAFLMSDLATGVVGDVIYVDKGVHLI